MYVMHLGINSIDVTLADENANSMLADVANMTITSNMTPLIGQIYNR